MKFYNIISNNFKQSACSLFLVFFTVNFQAQNLSVSPYSRFGTGDLQTTQTPRNAAMGHLSVGLTGLSDISTKNPASYLNLDSLSVLFDVSMQGTYSVLQEQQAGSRLSANTNNASLGQISFAFPITSWLKSCFGLVPNSNMSYRVRREFSENPDIGKHELYHIGQGGLNQAFLGLAVGTSRAALGVNVNYQFGSFNRQAIMAFPDTVLAFAASTSQTKNLNASGVSFDLGFQYRHPLSKNYQLGFGFAYTPKHKLNATRNFQIISEFPSGEQDTIFIADSEKGTLQIPDSYTIGLSLENLKRWVVGMEYSVVNYKNYREFSESDQHLTNAYTFRFGAELKGQRLSNDFLSRLSYRIGYHYGTGHVIFEDSKITQFGVSFGLGMPIRRTQSRLDFAVEIGRKGNLNAGQIQENYGRIVIGISAFDHWFMRGKFD